MSSESGEAGFSLVEALAALAVFALAGVGLVILQTYSVRTLGQVEERALAELVAHNALVTELAANEPPVVGRESQRYEAGGRAWDVMRTVSQTQETGALQIDIVVSTVGSQAIVARVRGFALRPDQGAL